VEYNAVQRWERARREMVMNDIDLVARTIFSKADTENDVWVI
jgi:hypothetical protein